jgi:hypothetical protein
MIEIRQRTAEVVMPSDSLSLLPYAAILLVIPSTIYLSVLLPKIAG